MGRCIRRVIAIKVEVKKREKELEHVGDLKQEKEEKGRKQSKAEQQKETEDSDRK